MTSSAFLPQQCDRTHLWLLSAASQPHAQRLDICCDYYNQLHIKDLSVVPVDKDGNSLISHLILGFEVVCVQQDNHSWDKYKKKEVAQRKGWERVTHKQSQGAAQRRARPPPITVNCDVILASSSPERPENFVSEYYT